MLIRSTAQRSLIQRLGSIIYHLIPKRPAQYQSTHVLRHLQRLLLLSNRALRPLVTSKSANYCVRPRRRLNLAIVLIQKALHSLPQAINRFHRYLSLKKKLMVAPVLKRPQIHSLQTNINSPNALKIQPCPVVPRRPFRRPRL